MRLLRLGLLIVVPALLAAAPDNAETAAWQPAAPANSAPMPAPTLRMADTPEAPVSLYAPAPRVSVAPLAAPHDTPSLRPAAPPDPAPVAAPILAPVAAHVTPAPAANDYGPQRLTFPDSVAAAFDVPYQTLKGYRPLTLDLYQPRPRNYPLPLLVFVHGGGFGGGDSRHNGTFDDFPAALAQLAAQGYVVASVNYRLSGEARFPAALLDVKAAIRWLKARAVIDTTRVAVWGAGTGGQLAALAGTSCGVPALTASDLPNDAPSECVQAVIDWYGPTDIKSAAQAASFNATDSDLGVFLGCEPAACPPGLARLASPIAYASVTSPNFLIVHGDADAVVPLAQSQALAAALKAKGAPAELVVYPGVGQGFTRGGAPDPAMNRQAMEKLVSFLAQAFPPGPIGMKTAARRGPLY
jgi:acetyl esterase/lipase